MGARPVGIEERWRSRRITAAVLRALIFLVPIAAGFAVGAMVAQALPEPTSVYEVAFWWIAIIAVATVTSTAVDRFARKLLPLTVLLGMTMLFPDAAPSRLRTARRAGNVSELRRRIVEARTDPASTDLAEMAELVLSLSTALSNHDRKTRGHSERTRAYTDMIAEEMGLPEADRDRLRWAALLHDVGKLEVPTEILNKSSGLDDDEWELIRQHPVHGMRLVAPLVPWLGEWAETIEHHHERYDGSGYPHGLAGDQICLGARIVTVADAYDVMTSGRSYQSALTPAAARREIASMAGVQFDPVVARALMNVSLGRLRWTTGPLAAIFQIPYLRGLPQMGRDLAMVLTTSAVMTTGFVTGAIPAPDGLRPTPVEIVEVVIAGAGIGGRELPAGTPTDLPLAAMNTDSTTTSTRPPDPTTTTTRSAPTAEDDHARTAEDQPVTIPVLANDTAGTGTLVATTLSVVDGPAMGTAARSGDAIRYSPDLNRHGTDRFVYRVCNSSGFCDTATVTVTVTPVNDPPHAPPRSATTNAGVTVTVPLGYSDPDGDVLRCALASAPAVGAATVPADCSALQYSPPASHAGVVTVQVRVTDGTIEVTGTVTITVIQPNRAPVAVADSATSTGGAITIPVLANDSDPDGDPLTLISVTTASAGHATLSGNSVVYTPPAGFDGTASFSYTVCDPGGLCATAGVSVTVNTTTTTTTTAAGEVVATADEGSVKKSGSVTLSLTSNDSGPLDKSTLSVDSPSSGSVSVLGNSGQIRYDAEPGFTGTVTFGYTVCSVDGDCSSATVTIRVD